MSSVYSLVIQSVRPTCAMPFYHGMALGPGDYGPAFKITLMLSVVVHLAEELTVCFTWATQKRLMRHIKTRLRDSRSWTG